MLSTASDENDLKLGNILNTCKLKNPIVVFASLIVVSLLIANCDRRPVPESPNVLLITFDTVRADHFKCYGKENAHTPTVDTLAEQGVLFENCSSPVPITLPAHTSMMTGLYPPKSGVRTNGSYYVDEEVITLAELLYDSGYQTAAFVSARVLESQYGLDQGFQIYSDQMTVTTEADKVVIPQKIAEEISTEASGWLNNRTDPDRPYFLWAHYYDPHMSYNPPAKWMDVFPNDPYSGEIAYTDNELSRLLEAVDVNSTLVVFAGDHGESLGEHGEITHAYFAYEATQHVPMIIRYPDGKDRGKRISEQVSLVDIFPTVLDYVEIETPAGTEGISLNGDNSGDRNRSVYVESITPLSFDWSPLAGFKTLDWKYIAAPTEELYYLPEDPYELKNMLDENPEQAQRFRKELRKMRPLEALKETEETRKSLDAEDREMLAALGYVGSTKINVPDDFSQLPDPKEKIDEFNLYQYARREFFAETYDTAQEKVQRLIESEPNLALAHYLSGQIYMKSKQIPEAIQALEKALELEQDNPSVWFTLAKAYNRNKDFEQAIRFCQDGIVIFPEEAGLYDQICIASRMKGDLEQAIENGKKAVELAPEKVEYLNNLGTAYMATDELDKARRALEKAVALDDDFAEGRYNLGVVHLRANRYGEAEEEFRKTLAIDESDVKTWVQLNKTLLYQNKSDEALETSEKILLMEPQQAEVHYFMSVAYRQKQQLDKAEEELRLFLKFNPKSQVAFVDLIDVLLSQTPSRKEQAQKLVAEMRAKGITVPESVREKLASD